MQLATRTRAFTAAAAKPRSSRVACRAVSADSSSGSRRQALALLSFGCGAALLPTNSAWALIPDEEDEELLEKAKANRQKRLNSQKETTREFLRVEGVKDKQLESELIPVQKAVIQLAKSGSQLEGGDVKAAASTLNGRWVEEFRRATSVLDANESEQAQATAVFDGLTGLRDTANKGDLKASKQQFVAVVSAVQSWAKTTGLAADLKGL